MIDFKLMKTVEIRTDTEHHYNEDLTYTIQIPDGNTALNQSSTLIMANNEFSDIERVA